MCYNGKCLHCIPVEHGSLALGIISSIGTGLSLLWSSIYAIIVTVELNSPPRTYDDDHEGYKAVFLGMLGGIVLLAVQIFFIIVAVGSLIALIFSILLCVGVCKRRPGQVLAYFIYGVIVEGLLASGAVIYLCHNINDSAVPGILGLFACAIYCPCLVMVYKTYLKLQQEALFKNHIPLVESTLGPYP